MTTPSAARRVPMSARLLAASPAILMLAEIVVFIAMFRWIGWWAVLGVMALSALGVLVIGSSSKRAWRDIRQMRSTGSAPRRTASDAAITLVGGLLLAVPGYLTALFGLILLLPFTRSITRRLVGFLVTRRVGKAFGVNIRYGAGRGFGGPVVPGERVNDQDEPEPPSAGTDQAKGRRVIEGTVVDHRADDPDR